MIYLPATPLVFCPTSRGQLCEVRHDTIWLALQVCDLRAGVDIHPGRVVHRVDGGPKPAPRAPWHAVGPAALPTFVCAGELAWALCNYPARFPPVNASLNLNAGGVATLG